MDIKRDNYFRKSLRLIKKILLVLGMIFFIMILLSFTDLPFWAYYKLGTKGGNLESAPSHIVLLGNSGMPCPDGLMKCYATAEKWKKYPDSKILIALPGDSVSVSKGDLHLMCRELIIRGVDSIAIKMETNGINTYSQALNMIEILGKEANNQYSILLVTSPEHMYRSVLTFRKVGFVKVGGEPTFAKDLNPDLLIKTKDSKLHHSDSLAIRYNVWNYFKYQVTVIREYIAIVYYKFKGWI